MEETILRVEDLSHRYSTQWAVRDINFSILGKGVYGLLGSNGAGKSTIMNIICGVLKATMGEVHIKGVDIKRSPVKAKKLVGFLPQKPPLYNDFTVEEYLTYCAALRHTREREIPEAVESVTEKCGITHFRKRLIRNLSGGYQQRVGIAQAIIHNPEFIILDEPTNGLDPNQMIEIRHLIKSIAEERTVILSTHILSEVQATCNYIWMLEQGSMVFSGSVEEFDNYIVPDTLIILLKSPPIVEELKAISGVVKVKELGGGRFRLQSSDSQDTLEKLIHTSVIKGWAPQEAFLEKSSMDTIFAELSKTNHKEENHENDL